MLSTVLPLILRATGSVLGRQSTKGLMTLRARPARGGDAANRDSSQVVPQLDLFRGSCQCKLGALVDTTTRNHNRLIPSAHLDLRGNRLGLGEAVPLPAPPLVDRARLNSWA